MRFLRKVGRRGVLTTPNEVREVLDIQEGDIVEFEVVGVIRRGKRTEVPASVPSVPASREVKA